MAVERTGSPTAFWNAVASVASSSTSNIVNVARWNEQIVIYVKCDQGATVFNVEVAHHGALTADGNEPDESSKPADANFYPLNYLLETMVITTNASGVGTILIPDFEPEWVRLRSVSLTTNVTAGYEATGE